MSGICTLGEPICEIMRTREDVGLKKDDLFRGPYASGAPAIFADSAAKMGTRSVFIGTVGDDDFGHCIRKKLEEDGVDCTYLGTDPGLSTGVAFVAYKSDGSRTFLYHIGNAAAGQVSAPETLPEDIDLFHVMGCSMMPSPRMAAAVISCAERYHSAGKLISFDPNIRVESLKNQDLHALIAPIMQRCSILMPGLEELLTITGMSNADDAIKHCFENPELKVIVLKNGSRDTRVISRSEDIIVPACKIEAVDPTGAGDSFDAAFLSAYLDGRSLLDCTRIASAAGAINCCAFGPMEGHISPEAVAQMVQKNY